MSEFDRQTRDYIKHAEIERAEKFRLEQEEIRRVKHLREVELEYLAIKKENNSLKRELEAAKAEKESLQIKYDALVDVVGFIKAL